MRLLFDEQLSESLVSALADLFPNSLHVRLLGQGGAADPVIWEMARERGYLIATKDDDFHRLSVLRGAPPKVVWVRLGNCSTGQVGQLLRERAEVLRRFDAQSEATFLELKP